MKLFAIGTKNPNPSEWSIWDEVSVLIAEDKDKALLLARENNIYSNEICEIDANKAQILFIGTEPNFGEDL